MLDYAAPPWRDFRTAEFFFGAAARDIAGGAPALFRARASAKAHVSYLRRMGFARTAEGDWELRVDGKRREEA